METLDGIYKEEIEETVCVCGSKEEMQRTSVSFLGQLNVLK